MKPYYEDDQTQIWLGDCREILPQLARSDAMITDPPFGIGYDYGKNGHDDSFEDYEALLLPAVQWAKENALGAMFWQAMKHCSRWHSWFPDDFRILAAAKGFVQFRPTPIQYSWDPVIAFGSFQGEPSVEKKDYHLQLLAPFGAFRERIDHPCPRPLEQVRYFVALSGAQTVIDPFMGSGTTLVAAKALGIQCVGIEREERYCEIAARRLQQEYFRFEPPKPKQEEQCQFFGSVA